MSFLDELLSTTRDRIEETKAKVSPEALEQRLAAVEPPRGFNRALTGEGVSVIAEIKRATPAKGVLDRDLNAGATADAYARGGAAAISVLTEPSRFLGTMDDLTSATRAGIPVLRKDFILDEIQVLESRAARADAVLLIVRILGPELPRMIASVRTLGMDALVEVHDESELEPALDGGAEIIGINHRDLTTFEVDPERTAKLAPLIPEDRTIVALSGVTTRSDVEALGVSGVDAVLVGESLVTADDPVAKLQELLGR